MAGARQAKTIFVRNLPFTATNEDLEEVFSAVGPTKSCFVVKNKDTEQNRGYGYVTYSLKEDAEEALKKTTLLKGRKLLLSRANQKPKKVKKKTGDNDEDDDEADSGDEAEDTTKTSPVPPKPSSVPEKSKRKLVHEERVKRRSVILKNTTSDKVEELIKQTKNVSSHSFPEEQNGAAVVVYKSRKDAMRAVRKLQAVSGSMENACILKELNPSDKVKDKSKDKDKDKDKAKPKAKANTKESRLIVRNLSFKCKPDELKKAFTKFGTVTDAVIPLKPDGKMFGYGFVQLSSVEEATEALSKMNGKQILGRPVAVDWAVAKSKYEQAKAAHKDAPEESESSEESSEEDKDEEEEEEDEEEEMDVDQHSESESEVENESEEEEESGDETDSGLDSDSDMEGSKKKKKKPGKPTNEKSDTEDGKTVFIRNLAFECEEEALEEKFTEFGDIAFARIVMDPNTGHSRGSAFVKFKSPESAQKCVEAAEDSPTGGITMDSRRLNVTIAISRERATKLQEKKAAAKKDNNKDNRNLWLAREGLIRPGTQAAEGLSKVDLDKRTKVEQMKREKLKNPAVFISTTRLCVRNIPTRVDDNELRKTFVKAVGDKTAAITECRIMRDLGNVNASGQAKSRGYAFVNFKEHKHALAALRNTNNNPDIFGEKKRLIVEFSLENKAAITAKEKRVERNKAKTEMLEKGKASYITRPKQKKKKNEKKEIVQPTQDDEDEDEDMAKKKGVKGLPSHWGPKIRHKARPAPPKKKAEKPSRKEKRKMEQSMDEQPPAKKNKKGSRKSQAATDDFDRLVQKYSQKLQKQPIQKSKWFND